MGRRIFITVGIAVLVGASMLLLVLYTSLGARLAVRTLLPTVNAGLNGSVTVSAARGAIARGLQLDGLTLVDARGTTVASVGEVRLEYRLRDMLAKRWVFQRVMLSRPNVRLIQENRGEPPSLFSLFRSESPPSGAPARVVELRNVSIEQGRLDVTRPVTKSGDNVEAERFSELNGSFPLVRFGPTGPGAPTLTVQVSQFSGVRTDSSVVVRAVRGQIDLQGDTLNVALSEVRLAESILALSGSAVLGEAGPLLDVTLTAQPVLTDEVRQFNPVIPAGLTATGAARVRTMPGSAFGVQAESFEARTLDGSEQARGRVQLEVDASGRWVSHGTRISFEDVELDRVRGFIADTVPIDGRMSGIVAIDGPRERFYLEIDGTFRDASVAGHPRSSIRARGTVALTDVAPRVSAFRVERANLHVASLARFVSVGSLDGVIGFEGVVDGSTDAASAVGVLAHVEVPGRASVIRGSLRTARQSRGLYVWAEVDVDSLQQTTLGGINSELAVAGPLAGRVNVAGRLDSLGFHARMVAPAGEMDGRGTLALANGRVELDLTDGGVRGLDLSLIRDSLPRTNLYARAVGGGVLRPASERAWRARVALDSSTLLGVRLDSIRTALAGTDSVVHVDTLSVWGDHLRADGAGTVALRAPYPGTYRGVVESDSVGVLEPWIAQWFSTVTPDTASSGILSATVTGVGPLDAHEFAVEFQGRDLRRGDIFLSVLRGDGSWDVSTSQFRVAAHADSAVVGPRTLRSVAAAASGRPQSFEWNGDVVFYADATVGARGSVANDTTVLVSVDSAVARVGLSRWVTDTAVRLTIQDRTVAVSELRLVNTEGPGRVTVSGTLPGRVSGSLTASLQDLSLADVLEPLGPTFTGAAGDLGGTVLFTGTAAEPSFNLDFVLRDGAFNTVRTSLVEGRFRYEAQQLNGEFTVQAFGRPLINVRGQAPLDLALQDVGDRRVPGMLEIRAIADSVALAMVEPFFARTVRNLEGTVVADVTVGGTWEQPELGGQLVLTDGAASIPALGLRHRQAEAELVLSGNTIRVNRAAVTSGSGTVTVTGSAAVTDLTDPTLDLRLQARDFRLIDRRDLLTMTASADVTLRGPVSGATLTGRGVASRGDLFATDLLEKQVVNLADTMFAAYVDTTVLRAEGAGSLAAVPFVRALQIDTLRFRLGSDVWMRSSEADVQLAGDVSVIKRGDEYRLNGTLAATRGLYRLQLGPAVKRDFIVTRGEIRFLGTPDLNADLDIETQHQIRSSRGTQMTVNAHLGGTVYQPRLTLSSDVQPPLSETEIVSYLLFGAPSVQAFGEAGGNQGRFVFEQSVDRFASVLAGEIERSLINGLGVPLDYLQIRPGEVSRGFSGTEIAFGKQLYLLGRPAFLVASPRLCSEQLVSTRNVGASLEFRVTRKWLIAASVDPLRACEAATAQALTRYQLGWDVFWETSR